MGYSARKLIFLSLYPANLYILSLGNPKAFTKNLSRGKGKVKTEKQVPWLWFTPTDPMYSEYHQAWRLSVSKAGTGVVLSAAQSWVWELRKPETTVTAVSEKSKNLHKAPGAQGTWIELILGWGLSSLSLMESSWAPQALLLSSEGEENYVGTPIYFQHFARF